MARSWLDRIRNIPDALATLWWVVSGRSPFGRRDRVTFPAPEGTFVPCPKCDGTARRTVVRPGDVRLECYRCGYRGPGE